MSDVEFEIGDRIEIYTPSTGTYWGFVVEVGAGTVEVDGITPTGGQPTVVDAADVVRRVPDVRRRGGEVQRRRHGMWKATR